MSNSFVSLCEKAFNYFSKMDINGLCECIDMGQEWLFVGGNPDETYYGLNPIVIDKRTSIINTFLLTIENLEEISSAKQVEIPEKYKFVSIA